MNMDARKPQAVSHRQLGRVRSLCSALPGTSERFSHGEPTFFVHKKVFVMFANDHHGDGHIAVWLPAPPGVQSRLMAESPDTYFKPPYVGGAGWVGVELVRVSDEILAFHIQSAWELIAPPRLLAEQAVPPDEARGRTARPARPARPKRRRTTR
jgi:hypothetical protein